MERGSRRRGPKNRGGRPARPPKRTPPPPRTGLESRYFDECMASGEPLRILLRDGREIRGTVSEHDRDSIHVQSEDLGGVVVRKTEIRYLVEE